MEHGQFGTDFIKGKTILITGGASGFGANFAQRWAVTGATVVIGDVNEDAGQTLVTRVKTETPDANIHFVRLDVCSWTSQVDFFRAGHKLSPQGGGIDVVVASAGINDTREAKAFEAPAADFLNDPQPEPPSLKTVNVNLTGVLYTTHLAIWYLQRNGLSTAAQKEKPHRDRHLLLVGSIASLLPLATQVPYGVSKHAVLGLFRGLRRTAWAEHKIRVNLLCPFFVETPILGVPARLLLAGGAKAEIEDVEKAATMLANRTDMVGRAIVICPRGSTRRVTAGTGDKEEVPDLAEALQLLDVDSMDKDSEERAIWEVFSDDAFQPDYFTQRLFKVINTANAAKKWTSLVTDILSILIHGLLSFLGLAR